MKKVLIINEVHEILIKKLEKQGFKCDMAVGKSYTEISQVVEQYTGIILRSGIIIDKNLIDRAKNLKFIGRLGSGLESIDVDYCKSKNIACLNSPEGNRNAVAEHALGMLLNILNNITKSQNEVRNGLWLREENRGTEIKGKTIGIIGYGNTGSAFALKLKGFGANVISWDKYKFNYSDGNTRETTLEDIFENAGIVSLHVPLTNETKYMVNSDFISSFRKNFYLINTSRGPVVNTAALFKGLESGKISGAALDVIEYEEYSFDRMKTENIDGDFRKLLEKQNVILTSHIAGFTHESKFLIADILADKIIGFYSAG